MYPHSLSVSTSISLESDSWVTTWWFSLACMNKRVVQDFSPQILWRFPQEYILACAPSSSIHPASRENFLNEHLDFLVVIPHAYKVDMAVTWSIHLQPHDHNTPMSRLLFVAVKECKYLCSWSMHLPTHLPVPQFSIQSYVCTPDIHSSISYKTFFLFTSSTHIIGNVIDIERLHDLKVPLGKSGCKMLSVDRLKRVHEKNGTRCHYVGPLYTMPPMPE